MTNVDTQVLNKSQNVQPKNRLFSWCKVIALAYCHLPIVIMVGIVMDRPILNWLLVVGFIPWLGMALPCLILVIFFSLLVLPGVMEGQPASWLTPGVSMAIVLGGTAALFIPFYWAILKRAVGTERKQIKWRILLIIWTLLGNLIMIFLPPRGI